LTTILSSSIYGWNNLPIGDLLNRVIVVSQVGEHNSNFNVGFMVGISNWLVGFVNQLIAGGAFPCGNEQPQQLAEKWSNISVVQNLKWFV
jgi:hypothetical protein